ncbi:unnamed protein product [Phaeothamnion confervicola]
MVYRGKVYDVSGWREHPGGNVIFTHAGDDFTDIFAAFHPANAYKSLEEFYIGDLDTKSVEKKPAAQRDFESAYRDLRGKLVTMGLFNASLLFYVWKSLSNLAIAIAASAIVVRYDGFAAHMFAAALLAVFWQQCGWLAHDFLHHQVFKNRACGDAVGIFWGNVAQGFSVAWWKNKHNTHHAVPNLHESSPDAHDGDPDMDTMPLLAWSLKMAEAARGSSWGAFFIRYQAGLYFPILLVARISWLAQSFCYAFDVQNGAWGTKGGDSDVLKLKNRWAERAGLLLHYLWVGWLVGVHMGPMRGLAFICLSQMLCGLLLALVFGLGHNGMATYDAEKRPDFWKLQVTTTRNVTSTPFVDWFCGGLQYQVDHHLFPQVPRHHLRQVHELVESFCREQGVKYHEASMFRGTVEVLAHLAEVSTDFISSFPAM